jgi:purine catabolism regulator
MNDQAIILTVDDLVTTDSLGLSLLGGRGGAANEVLWAHSCELESPEQWLGPHELLMTVGHCVPTDPERQREFIAGLAAAGLAGVVIGDHETAPEISEEMVAEADSLGFPLMLAASRIPFAVVARHVAAASSSTRLQQVLALSKLYQIAASSDDGDDLIGGIETLLDVGLEVVDGLTGLVVLGGKTDRSGSELRRARRFELHGDHPAELVIHEYPKEPLDGFLLVHLRTMIETAADRVMVSADHRLEASEQSLRLLLRGAESPDLPDLLGGHLPQDGFRILAFQAEEVTRIGRACALLGLPVLVGRDDSGGIVYLPGDRAEQVRTATASLDVRVGVSSVFTEVRDVRAAVQEAERVLASSQYSDRMWTEFEGTSVSVLARSEREAAEIVDSVLGGLTASTSAAAKLRETLFAYLRHDRSWQETAAELGIHRQTLSYRLRRIQEETGLNVSRSADLASLWIAFQAWESLHGRSS